MPTSDATSNADGERRTTFADWLLGLSLLGSLPLAIVYSCDLWFRSDYRFFPLLMLVPLTLPLWRVRKQTVAGANTRTSAKEIPRRPISIGLWFASGLSAACGALLFSPWLAMLALTLAWSAWMLEQMRQTPWPRLLKWTLPLLVLLLLPLSERSDPLPNFSSNVTNASSSLLDLLGIAHLPAEQTLQLQSGRYDVAAACRGLGNPYLLLSLAVLLCISTRCSLSVGLLTVGSAPLWSWGGSVLLVTSSVWLAEKQDISIGFDERLWLAQTVLLIAELISLLLLKWSLQMLLAPFTAHSSEVGSVHKFFNRVVLWPEPDPLRKRQSREHAESTERDEPGGNSRELVRRTAFALAIVAGLFAIAGGISVWRLATDNPFEQPSLSELLTHPSATRSWVEKRLSQETLPDEFYGMRLIRFDAFATLGSGSGVPLTARWTYSNGRQKVELLASAPYRGSVAPERQRLLDGSLIVTPLQSMEVQRSDADDAKQNVDDGNASQLQRPPAIRVDELTLADSLLGSSYMAYTNWTIDDSSRQTEPLGANSVWAQMFGSFRYQPTSACLSLWLEGEIPESDEATQKLQQMLGRAAELVRQALAID